MLSDIIFKGASRLFAPKLAKDMRRGGSLQLSGFSPEDIANFIEIDDRGSDVTLFSFAGLAVLFNGLPAYEMKSLLGNQDYNLVFVRDIRRLCYHLTPEGEMGGLQFFEDQVRQAMTSLGSTYNVAIGTSAGGSAALYFGARCGLDQVLAFSPGYPLTVYCSLLNQLRSYLDIKRLVMTPKAYSELLLVTLGTWWSYGRMCRLVGKKNMWPVIETYRDCAKRPPATVFYGAGCGPDRRQAALFRDLPEVRTVALPTPLHNCAGYLKKRGELGSVILQEVRAGMQSARVVATQ